MIVKRVFFAATSSGLPECADSYSTILEALSVFGCSISQSWIIELLSGKAPTDSKTGLSILEQQQVLLREADLMVVECSRPSTGIGYLMHQAVGERTPILCLYDESTSTEDVSDMITGNHSTLIKLRQYNKITVSSVVGEYLEHLSGEDLHKFNFLATSEILRYIESGAETTGKSKSEFLRDEMVAKLIRRDIKK